MTDSTSALLSPPPYVHWSNDRCVLLSSGRCGVRDLLPATRSRKGSMSGCMVLIENGFVQKISSEDLTHLPSWEIVVTWTTVFIIMFVSYSGFERLRRGLDCYVFLVCILCIFILKSHTAEACNVKIQDVHNHDFQGFTNQILSNSISSNLTLQYPSSSLRHLPIHCWVPIRVIENDLGT